MKTFHPSELLLLQLLQGRPHSPGESTGISPSLDTGDPADAVAKESFSLIVASPPFPPNCLWSPGNSKHLLCLRPVSPHPLPACTDLSIAGWE